MGGGDLVNAPGPLIGRADDLEYLTAFVDQAAVSGGAPPQDGFLFLDRDKFHASFAGDLPARPRSWPTPRCPGA